MQHKCFKCGTEFDGNFCPECGEKWLEAKTCPKCGASLAGNAKFCNECGYSFISKAPPQKPAATMTPTPAATPTPKPVFQAGIDRQKAKLYAVCLYLPYVLIALFSVLFFFFYLAPVAVMPGGELFGETIPSESYGNIYQMTSGETFPALAGSSIACIVFAAFLLADALFCLYVAVIRHDTRGAKPLAILGHGLIAALLIIGCVMMGIVGKEDGGMGMISVGAAPILIVVFSSLEIVLSIASECVKKSIARNYPEAIKAYDERIALRERDGEERLQQYRETTPAPVAPNHIDKPEKPIIQKPIKPIYRTTTPKETQDELKQEMEKHIKRKRTLAALLFFHLCMSGTLEFLFWTYANMCVWALAWIPLILIAIGFIIWSRKCHIRGWHPEKIYRYKRLKASIIIMSVEIFITISSLFLTCFLVNDNQYENQYMFRYSEDSLHLDRTYGYVSDSSWFRYWNTGDGVRMGSDEEAQIIHHAEKTNMDEYSIFRNINGGFIIYKLEKDMDSLEATLRDYINNDENVSKYSHDKWTYAIEIEVDGAYGVSVSTDAISWIPVEDYTNKNYYKDSVQILSSDYFSDLSNVLYIKIEDLDDGTQLRTLRYSMCTVCELAPTIVEVIVNGYEDSLTVSLGVSLLYLIIAFITLFCQYHKTAKQRRALCVKLCGAESIKKSALSRKYEKELEAYKTEKREKFDEYKRQREIYWDNKNRWAVYRYQMSKYSKGKSYKYVPRLRIWCSVHKKALSVTAVALAAVITVTCVVATRDRRFRAESLVKIGLGADEARVIEVLGEPSEKTSTTWYYYSKNYMSLREDFAALEEEMMNVESMGELEKLYNESEKLDEKMKTIEYQWISVEFSIDNKVYEMVLDTTAVYGKKQEKAVGSITTFQEGATRNDFYSYSVDAPLSYAILYQDGSYWKGYISASQLPTKTGDQTIKWSNEWGSYSVTITVVK